MEAMEMECLDCGSGCCGFDPHQAPLYVAVSHSIAPSNGGFCFEIRTKRTCVLIVVAVKLQSNRIAFGVG